MPVGNPLPLPGQVFWCCPALDQYVVDNAANWGGAPNGIGTYDLSQPTFPTNFITAKTSGTIPASAVTSGGLTQQHPMTLGTRENLADRGFELLTDPSSLKRMFVMPSERPGDLTISFWMRNYTAFDTSGPILQIPSIVRVDDPNPVGGHPGIGWQNMMEVGLSVHVRQYAGDPSKEFFVYLNWPDQNNAIGTTRVRAVPDMAGLYWRAVPPTAVAAPLGEEPWINDIIQLRGPLTKSTLPTSGQGCLVWVDGVAQTVGSPTQLGAQISGRQDQYDTNSSVGNALSMPLRLAEGNEYGDSIFIIDNQAGVTADPLVVATAPGRNISGEFSNPGTTTPSNAGLYFTLNQTEHMDEAQYEDGDGYSSLRKAPYYSHRGRYATQLLHVDDDMFVTQATSDTPLVQLFE